MTEEKEDKLAERLRALRNWFVPMSFPTRTIDDYFWWSY
jgi:hypothetical protein